MNRAETKNIANKLLGVPVLSGVAAALTYMVTNQKFLNPLLQATGAQHLFDPTLIHAELFQNAAGAGLFAVAGIALGSLLSMGYILNDIRRRKKIIWVKNILNQEKKPMLP